jgi:hypothetical protein
MTLTPQAILRTWIVETLVSLGGSATRAAVLSRMWTTYRDRFTPADLEAVQTRPFEQKWMNRASWERDKMVKDGVLARGTGEWTLIDARREHLR